MATAKKMNALECIQLSVNSENAFYYANIASKKSDANKKEFSSTQLVLLPHRYPSPNIKYITNATFQFASAIESLGIGFVRSFNQPARYRADERPLKNQC